MGRALFISCIAILIPILSASIPARSASAQVIEMTEEKVVATDDEKEEELSRGCLSAIGSYEEVRDRIEDRIQYLESVAVVGELVRLKEDMERESGMPKECSDEVGLAIDSMIERSLKGSKDEIDMERLKSAAPDMEADLMSEYLELSDAFDYVCAFCGKKPLRLAEDPLVCKPAAANPGRERKPGRRECNEAMTRYENEHDAIVFRRDLCRQSAKIDGIDGILFWFQGNSDLSLRCAVEIKAYIERMRDEAEGESDASKYAFAVAKEKCGRALLPIYLRYGMAVKDLCESCRDAEAKLKRDGMSCY